jgi:hypothetical protein
MSQPIPTRQLLQGCRLYGVDLLLQGRRLFSAGLRVEDLAARYQGSATHFAPTIQINKSESWKKNLDGRQSNPSQPSVDMITSILNSMDRGTPERRCKESKYGMESEHETNM